MWQAGQCVDMHLGGCVDIHTIEVYRCVYNVRIIACILQCTC